MGSSLGRGWLLVRMEAIGWQRVKLDVHERAGFENRGRHIRLQVYRGHLPESPTDEVEKRDG
jgi:hypothetical protein